MPIRDPIAIFLKEHDTALVHLEVLRRSALEIRKKGYSEKTFRQLLKATEFVDEEVRVHNGKEEKALFPVVEKYVDGPTAVLRDDHVRMARIYKKLSYSIRALKDNNDDKVARAELAEAAEAIVQLMVNHIHKENQILFPLVKRFLTKEELRQVAQKML
ncbi:MAG TPA: hemerythrin domain-containing protein [Bacteroidota bacterium]|nr:hemerythrin domain-containing protein [Bacteroidota bacterium]